MKNHYGFTIFNAKFRFTVSPLDLFFGDFLTIFAASIIKFILFEL